MAESSSFFLWSLPGESLDNLIVYTQKDIIRFLKSIAAKPAKHAEARNVDNLKIACKKLIKFPYQRPERCFQTQVKDEQAKKRKVDLLMPEYWEWHDRPVPFCSVYDVLGYVLSVVNPPPPNAQALDFYLPLLTVYTRWCTTLQGRSNWGPKVTFVGWVPNQINGIALTSSVDDLSAIGATIPGRNPIKGQVQFERALWMKNTCGLPLENWVGATADTRNDSLKSVTTYDETRRQMAARFGHCAESLPLALKVCQLHPQDRPFLRGLALETDRIALLTRYDLRSAAYCVMDPCENCQFLMRRTGVDYRKFMRDFISGPVLQARQLSYPIAARGGYRT